MYARAKFITQACETRCRGKHCRVRCKDVILGAAVPKRPSKIFLRLQERDRKLIAAARKAGHSHVRTVRPAKRVASAAANRSIAAGATRGREFTPPTCVPNTPPSTNEKYKCHLDDICLIKPPKRLRVKSTVVLAGPVKRLKVKTTVPYTILQSFT